LHGVVLEIFSFVIPYPISEGYVGLVDSSPGNLLSEKAYFWNAVK
jgi:hypothetical protein